MSDGGEDGATRRAVSKEGGASEQGDQAKKHGSGGYGEANVHAIVGLDPNKECQSNELASAEGEVSTIEESGQLLELGWVLSSKLVSPM